METVNLISLILSLACLAFVVIGVLYGLIVGFKKSLASGIYNLVLVIVLVLVTSSLTTLVLQYDITNLNLQANGSVCATLGDYIVAQIEANPEIANAITNHPEIKDVILTLPSLLASPFIFLALFWTIKIVVFIISLPINLIIFCVNKSKQNNKVKNQKMLEQKINPALDKLNPETSAQIKSQFEQSRKQKPKKHRLAGMACGLVIGLIAVFATLIPFFGFGSAIIKLDEIKVDGTTGTVSIMLYADDESANQNSQSLLESLFGKETSQMITSAYKNNVAVNVTRCIGMEAIGKGAFNQLTKTKINGQEVKLLSDLETVMNVYADCYDIYNTLNKQTLTKEEMTDVLNKADKTVNTIFEVKFLNAVGNTVLPIFVDSILNDPDFPVKLPDEITKDEVKNLIVSQALVTISNYDFSFVKNVLQDLINILKTVNDNNILTPVYNNINAETKLTEVDYINLIKASNADFASKIASQITTITFVKDMSPTLIDGGLEAMFNALNKNYTTNNITKEKASQTFSTIIENGINAIKTINPTSDLYVSKETFPFAGTILDILKDPEILTTTQYNDFIEAVEGKLLDASNQSIINLNGVIENISEVESWKTELSKIADAFDDLETLYPSIKSEIDIETINLSLAGRIFDKLELTTLFGSEIRPIFNDVLDKAKTSLTGYETAIEILKIKDSDIPVTGSLAKVEWENELTALSPLIKEIFKFKDLTLSGNNKEDAEKLVAMCQKFDEVEQNEKSKIYSKKMQPLLTEIMTIAKNQDTDNALLYENIIYRLNNRKPTETLTDCVEKGAITYAIEKSIVDMTTEHGIKTALENAKDYIIENNTISKLYDSMEVINVQMNKLKDMDTSNIANIDIAALSSSLNAVKNTGSFPVSFTNEILSNMLDEIDISSLPNDIIQLNVENYISEQKDNLSSSTSVVDDNTYKNILNGLKDLIPSA